MLKKHDNEIIFRFFINGTNIRYFDSVPDFILEKTLDPIAVNIINSITTGQLFTRTDYVLMTWIPF